MLYTYNDKVLTCNLQVRIDEHGIVTVFITPSTQSMAVKYWDLDARKSLDAFVEVFDKRI